MEVKVLLSQDLIPKFYRNYALSLVKEAIKLGNKAVYIRLYETEKVVEKKPFNFEIFFKGTPTGDFYLVDKKPILKFSTTNGEILSAFIKGVLVLSKRGYEFYISEHLKDKVKPKLLGMEKKIISNTLFIPNFLLPESAKDFKEKTKGMRLEEKVKFYFESQGFKVLEILRLKQKRPVKHKFRDIILMVNPIELEIKVSAESKDKLLDAVYNGIGWFSSQGFGYIKPVLRAVKV
ncbi:MAG: hypothetical protein GXO21_04240 [Aquificae bacterium]|nr:hypothetical protein [Aquificota bacterium]